MSLKAIIKRARKIERQWLEKKQSEEASIPESFIEFCEKNLGLKLTAYQIEAAHLLERHNEVALRWCRQSGKTHLISAYLLFYALRHPGCHIAVVGPSWRQAQIPIQKINYFRTKLPAGLFYKPQKTIVRLKNGSVIQAFPNNPNNLRGFTLHIVYCDEMNFISNDEEMYDAISFALATTGGKFIASSTPWTTDSIFYRIFTDPAFEHFAKSHVTWREALEPNGPIERKWLERKRREYEGDPHRWRREMEAEWAEDEDVWLSQALICSCIDHTLEYIDFEFPAKGVFYAGLDLGKHRDYSALAILKSEGGIMNLVHMHRFPLKTSYASIIGYVKTIRDRWSTINRILVDATSQEYVVEDLINSGVNQAEGVKLTQELKAEMAQWLRQCMVEGRLKIPYDPDLIAELNVERFELTKEGKIKLSHPYGSHDDRFWALALACYASRAEKPPKLVRVW